MDAKTAVEMDAAHCAECRAAGGAEVMLCSGVYRTISAEYSEAYGRDMLEGWLCEKALRSAYYQALQELQLPIDILPQEAMAFADVFLACQFETKGTTAEAPCLPPSWPSVALPASFAGSASTRVLWGRLPKRLLYPYFVGLQEYVSLGESSNRDVYTPYARARASTSSATESVKLPTKASPGMRARVSGLCKELVTPSDWMLAAVRFLNVMAAAMCRRAYHRVTFLRPYAGIQIDQPEQSLLIVDRPDWAQGAPWAIERLHTMLISWIESGNPLLMLLETEIPATSSRAAYLNALIAQRMVDINPYFWTLAAQQWPDESHRANPWLSRAFEARIEPVPPPDAQPQPPASEDVGTHRP